MAASDILTRQETAETELGSWRAESHPLLIEYLRATLQDIRAMSQRDSRREVAGILFGTYAKDLVRVLAHRPFVREDPEAPLAPLSANDETTLLELLKAPQTDPQLKGFHPVGWYHAQPGEVKLQPGDLSIFNRYFPVRWQISLVLGVEAGKPTRAGFFFREKSGPLRTGSSYSEFTLGPGAPAPPPARPAPLERAPLNGAASTRPAADPEPIIKEPPVIKPRDETRSVEPAAPPLPAQPILIPQSPATAEPAVKEEPAAATPDEPIPPKVTTPAPEVRPVPKRETPEPQDGTPQAAPVSSPEPVAVVEFASWEEKAPTGLARVVRGRARWIWVSLAVLLVVGMAGYAIRRSPAPAARTSALTNGGLSLRAEKDGESLRVNWDTSAPVIKNANRAVLSITDGGRSEQLNLGVNELQSGSVMYAPVSADVNFQLSVYTKDSQKSSESVRIVTSRPSPLAGIPIARPEDPKPVRETPPLETVASVSAAPSPDGPPPDLAPSPETPVAKPFERPPASTTPREEPVRTLVAPPTATPSPPVQSVPLPLQKASPPEPPKPPNAVQQPPPATPPPQPARQSAVSEVIPPRPVRKVLPDVPSNIRSMMVGSLTIDVKVTVDANGQVVDAIPTSKTKGNRLSEYFGVRSAQAARQWKFEPAKMNGKNVSGETIIQFKF